jgi:GDP-L-fucose synthase
MNKNSRIYIAGHRGMVGSAIWRFLEYSGHTDLVGWTSGQLDLTDRKKTVNTIVSAKPEVIVIAAARVGGIGANSTYPVEFLNDNIRIQSNILEAAHEINVEKLLFLGSSCIYPKFAPQPIREEALLTGVLEETNIGYAIAKISGLINIKSYRSEYGHKWISAMPTNLYGPNDNYDLETSHVLPALIRKFHDAKITKEKSLKLWGDGSPLREFLHVDDLAKACVFLLDNYDSDTHINIGSGEEISIRNLAILISKIVGFQGDIEWDISMPNGTPRKLMDSSKILSLGWKPDISLELGISATYEEFKKN